ncbi:acyltransferase family protein [Pseudomonas taiwanensis]|uniref:acyltransferase family protein n=1 Tax=Pseudomonas taiwanensis TaxID=470150 RepID=UPI001647F588|nr:acyltransferase family protein [Pseudomonas taiwanensis]MBC3491889.1 acyltransferase [Pseudomonas taiwanensis]
MSRITQDQSLQLDSIRALSALIVLFGHTNQTLLLPTLKHGSTVVGYFTQLSVMVFFVLSGFLIGKSVCNNIAKNGAFNLFQYAHDRALRLYPPLIAALLLMVLLATAAPYLFPSGTNALLSIPGVKFVRSEYVVVTKELIGALLFLNDFKTNTPSANGPLWSLSIEAWYYVAAGALVIWPTRKWLAAGLLLATLLVTRKHQLFYMLAPIWFAGFGLAFLHQRKPEMNNRLFGWLFVSLTALLVVTVLLVWYPNGPVKGVWSDPLNHFRLASGLWFSCFLALLMGGAVRFPIWFNAHARYSYTLYVTHFPIMLFILGVSQAFIYGSLLNSFVVAIATIAIAIAVAKLLACFLENKTLLQNTASSAKRMVINK